MLPSEFTRMLFTLEFNPDRIRGMDLVMPLTHTAFLDGRRLAAGPLHEVAVAVLRAQQAQPEGHPLIFTTPFLSNTIISSKTLVPSGQDAME